MPAHLDLRYGPRERNTWDLFPATDPKAPCIVFIHGGYWQRNSKDQFANLIAGPYAHGWAGALPGYTLAPDATLTEIIAEINAALDWLAANGPAHGHCWSKVVLSGWSAGGHLTAMCLGHPACDGWTGDFGHFRTRADPRHVLNEKLHITDEEIVSAFAAAAADGEQAAGDCIWHGGIAAAGGGQPRSACEARRGASAGRAAARAGRRSFHHRA